MAKTCQTGGCGGCLCNPNRLKAATLVREGLIGPTEEVLKALKEADLPHGVGLVGQYVRMIEEITGYMSEEQKAALARRLQA
tara:strand:+ start:1411 stop:1656 length:246 start_codon:yes stop_codon:yes gene_type:complete